MSLENTTTNELYSMLSPDLCRELEKDAQSMDVPQGASLMQHGVLPVGLIILESGAVQVSVPGSRRSVSLANSQTGKVFGMRSAIAGDPSEIDVTCVENCRVTVVPRESFLAVLKRNPETYFAVAKILSGDLEIANRILRTAVRRGLRVRPVPIV
jgi:CRP-like cAMP-binding protein